MKKGKEESQLGAGDASLVDATPLAHQNDKSERYAEIWNSLSDEDIGVALLLSSIPESPAGTSISSLLIGSPEITVAQARQTLTKLQSSGIVAYDANWVWVIDQEFVTYLTNEILKWKPVAIVSSESEHIGVDPSSMDTILIGKTVVFKFINDEWESQDIELYRKINGQEPLREFEYRKPLASNQFFEEPTEFESSARTGYYPLAIAEGVRRPPNHLYRDDDMLVAAANFGTEEEPDWQIRCFPKSCIPESTWSEAEEKLK